ncbi:MAG: hypothetical protein U1E52_21410 [Geminicoccaceae bacterium]
MDTLPVLIAFVTLPALPFAYAIAQLRCLQHWRGGWQVAAMLPMLGWAGWIAIFCRDVAADPTSHNLFPFEIAIGAILALAYLGLLAILRCVPSVPINK